MLKIGWFSTGRDEAARQLLQAAHDKIVGRAIDGKISFVFSNREPGEAKDSDLFFELVRSYNIPLICLSHKRFKTAEKQTEWRVTFDREVDNRIRSFAPNLCVLAGYMLIVSEELCHKYNMINLHPAPPGGPTGSWQEVIWALIKKRADTAGAMMHLVTPELDRGPVISYCLFSIKGKPFAQYSRSGDEDTLFQLIRKHELAREIPLIIMTLEALSRGQVSIKDGRVIDAQGKPINGYDLSTAIDEEMRKSLK
ncbi:MAG: phosphoribosylglycinamide formyltransferase [Dehalococcoidia bacterium]